MLVIGKPVHATIDGTLQEIRSSRVDIPASSNGASMEGKSNSGCTLCKELRTLCNGESLMMGSMVGEMLDNIEGTSLEVTFEEHSPGS